MIRRCTASAALFVVGVACGGVLACASFGAAEDPPAQDGGVDGLMPSGDANIADLSRADAAANEPPATSNEVRVWLAADRLATTLRDGDRVAKWPDRGSRKNDAVQSSVGAQPLFKTSVVNGRPVVRMNPGGSMVTTAPIGISSARSRTIVAVIKLDGFANYQQLVAFGTAGAPSGRFFALTSEGNGPGPWYFTGGALDLSGGISDLSWHIHTVTFDGTDVSWRVDDRVVPNFPAPRALDTLDTALSLSANADYAEVIVADKVLTSLEQQAFQKYLNNKYAVY